MAEKATNLPEKLVATLRTWSMTTELTYNTAQMRYYQKRFFRNKTREDLDEAKKYERIVDELIDKLWPADVKQSNLFDR